MDRERASLWGRMYNEVREASRKNVGSFDQRKMLEILRPFLNEYESWIRRSEKKVRESDMYLEDKKCPGYGALQ